MNIVGISGVEGAMPWMRAHAPGLEEREYRISQGHDAAAALVVDGEVVAAVAEERLDRRKHSAAFPAGAIAYCLKEAGLRLDQVDILAHAFDYGPHRGVFGLDDGSRALYQSVYSRDALLTSVRRHLADFPAARVRSVDHHRAHAASAYFTSGWDDCLVVVLDGLGEVHSATVYAARDGTLTSLAHLGPQDSLGILYSVVTLHLGFDFNSDEYKIMGLAPYGDAARFRPVFDEAVTLLDAGQVRVPALHRNRGADDRLRYLGTRAWLGERLCEPRTPDDDIGDVHRDAAAALQECLNRALLHLVRHYARATGLRRLAMAGGVALNCTANGHLIRSGMFDDIYVQPAAGDDGSALGAALACAADAGEVRNRRMPVPFLGPGPCATDLRRALDARGGAITATSFASAGEASRAAAEKIQAGKVVAWYRGRAEFGPRALGHRSILADPGHPEMRDRINAMVKMREAFRPFAPAVSIEEAPRWFDVPPGAEHPYMITTVDVRQEHRAALPAITHVDGSARIQTVSSEGNPDFHALLKAVGRTTGREMVLNTSFNVKGQPIVTTPAEALDTFLRTGIDHLFLENTLVSRRPA